MRGFCLQALDWFPENKGGIMSSLSRHSAAWQIHVPECTFSLDVYHRAYYAGLLAAIDGAGHMTYSSVKMSSCQVLQVCHCFEYNHSWSGNVPSVGRCGKEKLSAES